MASSPSPGTLSARLEAELPPLRGRVTDSGDFDLIVAVRDAAVLQADAHDKEATGLEQKAKDLRWRAQVLRSLHETAERMSK